MSLGNGNGAPHRHPQAAPEPGFSIATGRGRHALERRPWWWQIAVDGCVVETATDHQCCATPEEAFAAGYERLLALLDNRVRMAIADRDLLVNGPAAGDQASTGLAP